MKSPRRRKPKADSTTGAFVITTEHESWLQRESLRTGATKSAIIRILLDKAMRRKEEDTAA